MGGLSMITIGRISRVLYRASAIGVSKGPHVTRYAMYNRVASFAEQRPASSRVLSISHSEGLARLIGFSDSQITDAAYPEHSMFDLPFEDETFDAVVSDQVLEHLEGYPQDAIAETFRILKPNGLALHTTCFINPMHACPNDYWRFTPQALELLVSSHGAVIEAAGWGNPYVLLYSACGLRFMPIPDARWHPGHWVATWNDTQWPISTWVLARKSSGPGS
jgi:SAM-dependent methyltransferase